MTRLINSKVTTCSQTHTKSVHKTQTDKSVVCSTILSQRNN